MVRVNMLWQIVAYTLLLILMYDVAGKCAGNDDLSPECADARHREIWGVKAVFILAVLTEIITMTQIYEWMSLRMIVVWQSANDLT